MSVNLFGSGVSLGILFLDLMVIFDVKNHGWWICNGCSDITQALFKLHSITDKLSRSTAAAVTTVEDVYQEDDIN